MARRIRRWAAQRYITRIGPREVFHPNAFRHGSAAVSTKVACTMRSIRAIGLGCGIPITWCSRAPSKKIGLL